MTISLDYKTVNQNVLQKLQRYTWMSHYKPKVHMQYIKVCHVHLTFWPFWKCKCIYMYSTTNQKWTKPGISVQYLLFSWIVWLAFNYMCMKTLILVTKYTMYLYFKVCLQLFNSMELKVSHSFFYIKISEICAVKNHEW